MKISLTNLKISIAGAKLSHLVQKDKIWDHGSMTEQTRITFYLVQKARHSGNIEFLKKYLTTSCYEKLREEIDDWDKPGKVWEHGNPVINELAVIQVYARKKNKPDMFTALIKWNTKVITNENRIDHEQVHQNCQEWSFVRQGEWWLLDSMK